MDMVADIVKVAMEDRYVTWHDEEEGGTWLLRPFDCMGMVLEFDDPVLHVVDRPNGSWKMIVDTLSQRDGYKSRWAAKIVGSASAVKVEGKAEQYCKKRLVCN